MWKCYESSSWDSQRGSEVLKRLLLSQVRAKHTFIIIFWQMAAHKVSSAFVWPRWTDSRRRRPSGFHALSPLRRRRGFSRIANELHKKLRRRLENRGRTSWIMKLRLKRVGRLKNTGMELVVSATPRLDRPLPLLAAGHSFAATTVPISQ